MAHEFSILIKNFIKDRFVATVAPSSKFVLRRICNAIDFSKDITLVEYGPGTGVITKAILEKMSSKSKLIAIEKNKNLCSCLRKIKDSRLKIINGDVLEIDKLLKNVMKKEKADYVVSGIPFSLYKKENRALLIEKTDAILSDVGRFIVYQFSPIVKSHLICQFANIKTSFEPINIPPLFIMEASK